jgi:hypothetical protein
MSKVQSEIKKGRFPEAIGGYNKFLKKKKTEWFEPLRALWEHEGVRISVNPELGFTLIDGKPTVIKLYFKNAPLSKNKVDLTRAVMCDALQSKAPPEVVFGVLDVQRGKLFKTPFLDSTLLALLKSEARLLEVIWEGLMPFHSGVPVETVSA